MGLFDRLLDAGDLVDRQIVHDHGIVALEGWDKALFHIGEKHRPIHGSLPQAWRAWATSARFLWHF